MTKTIGIIGAGAWGTALAQVLANEDRDVLIQAHEEDTASAINNEHENKDFLPGVSLNPNIKATTELKDIAKRDIILLVTPAQYLRATLEQIKADTSITTPLVICSKGIELDSGKLLSRVAKEVMPNSPIAILSGPTFAIEVAKGLPTAATIACRDNDVLLDLQQNLGAKTFRPYITKDIIGAELGGAIKNVIAIACGIVYGKKLGDNARAALLTRGIAEISRLALAANADKETLMGMCGIGDLMLTASSMQSRNFSLGAALGEGQTLEEILSTRKSVTEGIHTAKSALSLAKQYDVDMPITEAVNKCLNEGVPIDTAIEEMLERPFKYEMGAKKKAHAH